MGALVFVTGGARSGKSRFAEARAGETSLPVVYLATMEAGDEEVRLRIAAHRAARPPSWTTIEEPLDLDHAIEAAGSGAFVLVDCLSLWVSNMLMDGAGDDGDPATLAAEVTRCVERAARLVAGQAARGGPLLVVTNEVGMGIVPLGALSRAYRDALGLVNQVFAQASDEAYLLVSGLAQRLK